jgi:6-phosphogluconolactonase (cycloisomerase 2 family)
MSKRWAWLLAVAVLVSVGALVACGSKYTSSSDGLVLVGSQGSGLIQTFSFSLNSGHTSAIDNPLSDTVNQTCVLNGQPASIVMDPAGAHAYTIITSGPACAGSQPGIAVFQVGSDGRLTQTGSLTADPNPVALSMDSAGKFLFVAEGTSGLVNSYAIGSDGSLTLTTPTYTLPATALTPNIVAIAASPTVLPAVGINGIQNAVCSAPGNTAPTSEYLYAVDSQNYVVWQFSVDTSSGALGNPPSTSSVPSFPTAAIPAGVAVDPCNRFVYVSNDQPTNKVSAYSICTSVIANVCTAANGALVPVSGSPFSLTGGANGPNAIAVDPFGNNVYVVGHLSNTVSTFKISPVTGTLAAGNPATSATGSQPVSITIRSDDSWMFVSNFNAASVSQYSITPATGALTTQLPITTDNYPFGVAVK